ncbi:hypothetical protein HPG69_010964 [Diceros bicornis minor]|uniref:Uncharacterized protein n=1 Tax=Diceros bicornis minor TaxID=77932 RepID=A0A7J7EYG5_DICBM|nr:hypothetical protein HPG69_010964 [Diceros bicornis minor]
MTPTLPHRAARGGDGKTVTEAQWLGPCPTTLLCGPCPEAHPQRSFLAQELEGWHAGALLGAERGPDPAGEDVPAWEVQLSKTPEMLSCS